VGNFVGLPVQIDPALALEETFAEMERLLAQWEVNLAQPEVLLLQSIVYRLWAPLAQLAAESGEEMFNQFGRQIVAVEPGEQEAATVLSKWTARDSAGYEIPAGTQVDVERTGSDKVGFIVSQTSFIAPGKTNVTGVPLEAVEPGAGGNGLSGVGKVVDSLGWVVNNGEIELTGETSGGEEAEEPAHYLGRLAETMQTFVESVVTARQVEIVVRNIPGVGRVLAIDNYNAETKATEQEKTTTVVVASIEGLALSAEKKAEIKAKLAEKREINFLFFVVDPAYEEVDVTAKVVPRAGYSQAEANAAAKAAINGVLSPATFAQEPPGDETSWTNTNVLRYQDLSTAVNNAQQVEHHTELKLAKKGGTQKAEDLTLEGVAPLPKPGTVKVE
jgi:uncharacterized phage protein gp47/JayE